MAISDEITRLQQAKADLKTAIEGKGVTVPSSTKLDGYADLVDSIETGGGGSTTSQENDVTFYDYDGTIVASYSASEFADLSALPSNPSHTGLTAQGWNWTLAAAKTHVANFGKLDIGQMYKSSDNKTHILFDARSEARESKSITIYFYQSTANGVSIDFGDGSSPITMSGTGAKQFTHTYTTEGVYDIVVTKVSGSMYPYGTSSYNISYNKYSYPSVKQIILANSSNFNSYAFNKCYGLERAVFGSDISSISSYLFKDCFNLREIIIPLAVTSIGDYAFYYNTHLKRVILSGSVTSIGSNAFLYCSSLKSITPLKSGSIGSNAFSYCSSLNYINLKKVTSIGNYAFRYCYGLGEVIMPDSLSKIGNNVFESCCSLQQIIVPKNTTMFDVEAFKNCYSLKKVVMSNKVATISRGVFYYCYSLESIVIPKGVSALNSDTFNSCNSLLSIYVFNSTPPTNNNCFSNVSTDFKIYVPVSSVSSYQGSWSSYSSKIYGMQVLDIASEASSQSYVSGSHSIAVTTTATITDIQTAITYHYPLAFYYTDRTFVLHSGDFTASGTTLTLTTSGKEKVKEVFDVAGVNVEIDNNPFTIVVTSSAS